MSSELQLERKIDDLRKKLLAIGEMYPGAVSKQYNICGTPGCKCKDEENPVKHGPYSNLNFTFKGRSRTKFIRQELVKQFERYTANYKKFREYSEQLIECNIELINLRTKRK
jgi:hypothetical protein